MMGPTDPLAWEWAPDDSLILGTPVDENGANLEQVLLDPVAGTSRDIALEQRQRRKRPLVAAHRSLSRHDAEEPGDPEGPPGSDGVEVHAATATSLPMTTGRVSAGRPSRPRVAARTIAPRTAKPA